MHFQNINVTFELRIGRDALHFRSKFAKCSLKETGTSALASNFKILSKTSEQRRQSGTAVRIEVTYYVLKLNDS